MSKSLVEVVYLLGDLDLERDCPRYDISFETCDEDDEELLLLSEFLGGSRGGDNVGWWKSV